MSPVQFIPYNSKQILLMDFTNTKTTAEITQTTEEAKKIVELHKPRSLLVLVDFTGMRINGERIKIIQEMATHNRPYVKFIALVGLGFPRSMVFTVMLLLSGRKNHGVFRKREKALEWLGGW